jgi:hypothetical protein
MSKPGKGHRTAAQRAKGWLGAERNKRAGKVMWLPVVSSGWELLLREVGMTETEAIGAILKPECARLRRFAERHCLRRYVPEDVLIALGLREKAEGSETLTFRALQYQPRVAVGSD